MTGCARSRGGRAALAFALAIPLAACGTDRIGNPLSGGASMQIEVEVYKGPLSKEVEIQKSEYRAILREARFALRNWNSLVEKARVRNGCPTNKDQTQAAASKEKGQAVESSKEMDVACHIISDMSKGIDELRTGFRDLKLSNNMDFTVESLKKAHEAGARLKAQAFYWAEALQLFMPEDRELRALLAGSANMMAEYGNQIMSRGDVLLRQCRAKPGDPMTGDCPGTQRDLLPLSVYLREISPTEFFNLFVYSRATPSPFPTSAEIFSRPFWELGSEETRDRVRVIEKLFADHNWSRINTVHANGRGNVRMAFIKDDIGNWNLKSFSSDPSELVEAYTKLTRAAVGAVVDLATQGTSTAASSALSLAGRFARGRTGPGNAEAAGINIEALRKATERQAKQTEERRKQSEKKLDDPPTASPITMKRNDRLAAYNELRSILVHYDGMLESLQASVAAGAAPGTENPLDALKGLNDNLPANR